MEILTFSAGSLYLTCPRRYQLRHIDHLVPAEWDQTNLRVGSNWHKMLEDFYGGKSPTEINDGLATLYPEPNEEWAKLSAMFANYSARFPLAGDGFKVAHVEKKLSGEIENPDTSGKSRSFTFAGKCDLIVSLADGSSAIVEHKTTSRLDRAYMDRVVAFDLQTALYAYYAGMELQGRPIETVIYNAASKTSIRLKKGETIEEFRTRCIAWYAEAELPFWRQTLTLTAEDFQQAKETLWQISKKILDDKARNFFIQNPGACEKWGRFCEYYALCSSKNSPLIRENAYKIQAPHSELLEVSEPAF